MTRLQALALLNDPFMVRQAENFAGRSKLASDEPRAAGRGGVPPGVGPAAGARSERAGGYARRHGLAERLPGAVQRERVSVRGLNAIADGRGVDWSNRPADHGDTPPETRGHDPDGARN